MAGKVIDGNIVPGYPGPGVTAEEILALINRYGMPLGCNTMGIASVRYRGASYGLAQQGQLTNGLAPLYANDSVALNAWNVDSTVVVHLTAECVMQHQTNDDPVGGVSIYLGDAVYPTSGMTVFEKVDGVGTVSTVSADYQNAVPGPHGMYHMAHAFSVKAMEAPTITGILSMDGAIAWYAGLAGEAFFKIFLDVLRVL